MRNLSNIAVFYLILSIFIILLNQFSKFVRYAITSTGRTVPGERSAFLQHDGLVLDPKERSIIVLDEAAVELQGAAGRAETESSEPAHRSCHAPGAVIGAEVPPALEEAVGGVLRGRAGRGDGEVGVGGELGGVDEGAEDGVEVGLVGGARGELDLRASPEDEGVGGGRGCRGEEEKPETGEEEERSRRG